MVATAAPSSVPTAQEWFRQGKRIPVAVPVSLDDGGTTLMTVHVSVHVLMRVRTCLNA